MSTDRMPYHPASEVFRLMGEEEYEAFKEDIRINGLMEPIWTYQGTILDGRNRYRACLELGIEPRFREWEGKSDPVAFVATLNLHRRHLDASQRAMVAARLIELFEDGAKKRKLASLRQGDEIPVSPNLEIEETEKGKSSGKAAAIMNVSRGSTESARKVLNDGVPVLATLVDRGNMAVSAAEIVAKLPRDDQLIVIDSVSNAPEQVTAKEVNKKVRALKRERQLESKRLTISAKTKLMDQDNTWEIITGDCLDAMAKMELGTARLVFADPPYNQGIDYGEGEKADRLSDNAYLSWCARWMELVEGILTADGSFWVLISNEYADYFGCMLREIGFHRRSWIVWYETFGNNNLNGFNRTSRHLFYCVKDLNHFVFNPEAVMRRSDRQEKYHDKRANPKGKLWDDVWGINPFIPRLTGTSKERKPDFPTQLPVNLIKPVIECVTDYGDLVVDPFSGSGTTGEACLQTGRRYIGIEKSEHFAELSRARLSDPISRIPVSPNNSQDQDQEAEEAALDDCPF